MTKQNKQKRKKAWRPSVICRRCPDHSWDQEELSPHWWDPGPRGALASRWAAIPCVGVRWYQREAAMPPRHAWNMGSDCSTLKHRVHATTNFTDTTHSHAPAGTSTGKWQEHKSKANFCLLKRWAVRCWRRNRSTCTSWHGVSKVNKKWPKLGQWSH